VQMVAHLKTDYETVKVLCVET